MTAYEVLVAICIAVAGILNFWQGHDIKELQQDKIRLQSQVVELDKHVKDIQEQQQYILRVSQDISKRAGVQW